MKYSRNHVWIDETNCTIGISDYAQQSLGDIVYIDLPEVGEVFSKEEEFGSIESVKSVSTLYAPLSIKVVEVNEKLEDEPEIINSKPYEDGWILKVEILDEKELEELLNEDEYLKEVSQE